MKRTFYSILSVLVCLLLILSAAACSKEASADFYDRDLKTEYNGGAVEEGVVEDSAAGGATEVNEKNLTQGRKIIENIELSLQTKEFTELLQKVEQEISKLGGYVEESTTSGLDPESYRHRSAHLVVRIPSKQSGSFDAFLSENSVVTSRRITTEDVTLQYVDMESRVKALNLEKEALEAILQKAESVEDIISVRSQLTEVIYQIESYQSKLRTYDNLVDYCTINIHINEVERTTVVEKQNVWQKIGTNLKNNFENVGKALVDIFVFLISAIPYLIPLAVILTVVLLIVRKRKTRKKNQGTDKK
ncbi:MAG: DUF4349 domain-containing protein [Clostridia bacterium]|nr:DUF4349 domain-containing protein [Clostridia bacterium]